MKRDELSTKLRDLLDKLEAARRFFTEQAEETLEAFRLLYSQIDPELLDAYAGSLREKVEVEILPTTVMGTNVPFIKLESIPEVKDQYPAPFRKAAKDFRDLLRDLFKITELEIKIERIAEELKRTNRIVNTLEEIEIPKMEENIDKIEEKLEEERMEEFIRIKQVRDIIQREEG